MREKRTEVPQSQEAAALVFCPDLESEDHLLCTERGCIRPPCSKPWSHGRLQKKLRRQNSPYTKIPHTPTALRYGNSVTYTCCREADRWHSRHRVEATSLACATRLPQRCDPSEQNTRQEKGLGPLCVSSGFLFFSGHPGSLASRRACHLQSEGRSIRSTEAP